MKKTAYIRWEKKKAKFGCEMKSFILKRSFESGIWKFKIRKVEMNVVERKYFFFFLCWEKIMEKVQWLGERREWFRVKEK